MVILDIRLDIWIGDKSLGGLYGSAPLWVKILLQFNRHEAFLLYCVYLLIDMNCCLCTECRKWAFLCLKCVEEWDTAILKKNP